MIFNIRSTNGGGKSYIVHRLLADHDHEELWYNDEEIGVVVPSLNLRIVGAYDTNCGGTDWIQAGRGGTSYSVQMVEDLVSTTLSEDWMPDKHILFEGFMISGTRGRWSEMAARLAQKYGKEVVLFAFLDTPKEICAERIRQRRITRAINMGKDPALIPEFNTKNCYDGWRQGLNIRRHFQNDGRLVVDIRHEDSYEHFMEIFGATKP
jgi:hypothetical protein